MSMTQIFFFVIKYTITKLIIILKINKFFYGKKKKVPLSTLYLITCINPNLKTTPLVLVASPVVILSYPFSHTTPLVLVATFTLIIHFFFKL